MAVTWRLANSSSRRCTNPSGRSCRAKARTSNRRCRPGCRPVASIVSLNMSIAAGIAGHDRWRIALRRHARHTRATRPGRIPCASPRLPSHCGLDAGFRPRPDRTTGGTDRGAAGADRRPRGDVAGCGATGRSTPSSKPCAKQFRCPASRWRSCGRQVVLERGYGVRELGKPAQVDAHTMFIIALQRKAFTAASLRTCWGRRQAEDGRTASSTTCRGSRMSDAYVVARCASATCWRTAVAEAWARATCWLRGRPRRTRRAKSQSA